MGSGFWDIVCTFDRAMKLLTIVVFTFAFLTILTFPFLEPGTASHTIALVNIVNICIVLGAIGLFHYKCSKEIRSF
jgi:hypothetical protein